MQIIMEKDYKKTTKISTINADRVGLRRYMVFIKNALDDDFPKDHYENKEERVTDISNFVENLTKNQQDMDPRFSKVIDDHFWDLV